MSERTATCYTKRLRRKNTCQRYSPKKNERQNNYVEKQKEGKSRAEQRRNYDGYFGRISSHSFVSLHILYSFYTIFSILRGFTCLSQHTVCITFLILALVFSICCMLGWRFNQNLAHLIFISTGIFMCASIYMFAFILSFEFFF